MEEGIGTIIEMASPGVNILYSALGALAVLGAVAVLVVAVLSVVRAFRD